MKIAIVHDFLNQLGGAEKVLEALHKIFPQAPVYTLLYDPEKTKHSFDDWDIRPSYLQKWPEFLRKKQKLLLPFMPSAIESFDFSQYDLVISSSNAFAKGILTGPDTSHICYCHSPMRYAWDWYFEYLDENKLGWLSRKIVKLLIHKIRLWDQTSAERVDIWIANSQNVANRIKKYYRKDAKVIYPAVDIDNFKIGKIQDNYFLVISRLSAYKKTDLAVKAFNKLGLPLVVIGTGEQYNMLKKIAKSNVKIAGYKADKEVIEYLSKCRALIHPQEEDFGITQIEAMASGKPVIAFAKGGSLEVVKESENGMFFDEPTVESLVDTINKFEKKKNTFDPIEIRKSIERFDITNFQSKIKQIVEKIPNSSR